MRDGHLYHIKHGLTNKSSMWIKQSAPPFRHQHHLAGQNPELLTIFSKMQRLAALPVRVLLVYDGEKRPNIKRGVQVRGTPHWLTTYIQQMAGLFGFVNHTVSTYAPYVYFNPDASKGTRRG